MGISSCVMLLLLGKCSYYFLPLPSLLFYVCLSIWIYFFFSWGLMMVCVNILTSDAHLVWWFHGRNMSIIIHSTKMTFIVHNTSTSWKLLQFYFFFILYDLVGLAYLSEGLFIRRCSCHLVVRRGVCLKRLYFDM